MSQHTLARAYFMTPHRSLAALSLLAPFFFEGHHISLNHNHALTCSDSTKLRQAHRTLATNIEIRLCVAKSKKLYIWRAFRRYLARNGKLVADFSLLPVQGAWPTASGPRLGGAP